MYPSAYDLKAFYGTIAGRIVRRIIREKIRSFWPESSHMRVMGMGYAAPYLRPFTDTAERTIALMPPGLGAHHWPDDGKNVVALAADAELPVETNSIDRILMIHSLEHSGVDPAAFEELWRVLKSSGRILIVVPNRMGLWARAEWSPFGQGTPFSAAQVERTLRENLFVHERTDRALYVPPFKREFFLKSARYFENAGPKICPALGGLHFVEASKQLYAGTLRPVRPAAARGYAAPVLNTSKSSREISGGF